MLDEKCGSMLIAITSPSIQMIRAAVAACRRKHGEVDTFELLKEKGINNMNLRAKSGKLKIEKRKAAEGERALALVAEEAPEDD